MRRIEFSSGQVGQRSVLADQAKLFTLELLFTNGEVAGSVNCTMNLSVRFNLEGRRPAELVDGLSVLDQWHTPNRVAFGSVYGPPNYNILGPIPTAESVERSRWAPICQALARIQEHTTAQLRMPKQMDRDQAFGILEAAGLLTGEPATGTVSGEATVTHTPECEIEPQLNRLSEFMVIKDLEISLDDETISVGKQAMLYRAHYVEIGQAQPRAPCRSAHVEVFDAAKAGSVGTSNSAAGASV